MLTQNPHVSWKKMETSIWGGFTEMNICPEGLRWVGPLNRPATSIPGAATSTAQTENKKVKTESAVCETRVSVMRVCVFVYVCRRQGHRRSSFRGSYGETFSKLQHLRWEGCLLHSAYTPWRLRLRQIRFYVKLFFYFDRIKHAQFVETCDKEQNWHVSKYTEKLFKRERNIQSWSVSAP